MSWRACAAGLLMLAAYLPNVPVASAQVRRDPDTSDFINPASGDMARLLFGRGGYFMIAGGVLLDGSASFVREAGGATQPVAAASVQLAPAPSGVEIRAGGAGYMLATAPGLACPLGRFVRRDGLIAYTIPKFLDPDSRRRLLALGIVRHRVAREFDGTPFETLLRAADFGATVPLDPRQAQALSASLNAETGVDAAIIGAALGDDGSVGSLINADMQVRYRVYLDAARGRAEIAGVPVRYYWQLDRSGAAGVFAMAVYAQSWPPGAGLTPWAQTGAAPTQYDIVAFYQLAGLFRQVHETDPAGFAAFVDRACASAPAPAG